MWWAIRSRSAGEGDDGGRQRTGTAESPGAVPAEVRPARSRPEGGDRPPGISRLQARIVLGFTAAAALGLTASLLFPGSSLSWPAGIGILLAAAGAGFLVSRGLRKRIRRLDEAAGFWERGDLGYRVAHLGADGDAGGDDLEALGRKLDQMAAMLQRRDETARRQVEEQMVQAEKLATVGRLAAGVAHELNNPLGGILLYGNLVCEATPPGDPRYDNMRKIVIQATRAREIVKGLLAFARQSPPVIETVDLNTIVAETLSLLERHPQFQNVQIRTELSPLPLPVRADGRKMQQVFINILLNGAEAMRKGGTLTVRSGFSERDGFCRVAVTDTGSGITADNLGRIFEPFFTTKEVGQGVGLGLSISYGIVQQHRGEIEVQTAVGSGTTFRVLLPLDSDESGG
jgi:signal transduction histidine kinase